jgi:ABC-type lipoprotein release transport system permease subunit
MKKQPHAHSLLDRRIWGAILPAALLNSLVLVIFFSALASQQVLVDRTLKEYQRTTYDILVRAPENVTEIEKEYGLVEANHLNGTAGGITMEQYAQIKAIPNVEVAAPIAVLGYMDRIKMGITILDPSLPAGIYRISGSAGIVEGGQYITSAQLSPYYALHTPGVSIGADELFTGWGDTLLRLRLSITMGGNDPTTDGFMIFLPQSTDRMLIAAIDPEQEAKLVHLDDMLVSGSYLPQDPPFIDDHSYIRIPVLFNIHDYIQQTISVQLERLDFDVDVKENFAQQLQTIPDPAALDAMERQPVYDLDLTLQHIWQKEAIDLQVENGKVIGVHESNYSIFGTLYAPTVVQYRILEKPPAGLPEDTLVLEAIPQGLSTASNTDKRDLLTTPELQEWSSLTDWQVEPEVTYRPLSPRFEYSIMFNPYAEGNGQFDIDTSTALGGSSLNQVPLETYLPPSALLKYDENGEELETPVTLTPTLNNEGYLVSPPDVLISLTSAQQLLEYGCADVVPDATRESGYKVALVPCEPPEDFISAIRVRVGGIDEMDAHAQARIEQVADEIVRQTGLHVDVMVGSSPQPVLVHIPGYEGTDELGYVEEYWVKKNVNTLIQTGMNLADGMLFAAMLCAGILLLFNLNTFLMLGRISEVALYNALGWRRTAILKRLLLQVLPVGLLSTVLAALLSLVIIHILALQVVVGQFLLVLLLELAAFMLSALLPAWQISKAPPAVYLQKGEAAPRTVYAGKMSMRTIIGNNIKRKPARSLTIVFSVLLTSGLLTLISLVQGGLQGQLYGTLLGRWIHSSIQPYHQLMELGALLMTGMNIFLSTRVNVNERKDEIGLLSAMGWRRRDVANLFCWEQVGISLAGAALGLLLGVGIFWGAYRETALTSLPWLQTILLGLVLPVGLSYLTALYPAYRGASLLPLEALREKAGKARQNMLRSTALYVGLGLLGLFAVVFLLRNALFSAVSPDISSSSEMPSTGTVTAASTITPAPTPTPVLEEEAPHYHVDVVVDPDQLRMTGQETITYTNNTGVPLEEIVLRLYANIPFGFEEMEKDPTIGYMFSNRIQLDKVNVDGQPVEVVLSGHNSVATLRLENPLAVGQSITMDLSFTLQGMDTLNYVGSVWTEDSLFPMLAVYDQDGWRQDITTTPDIVYSQSARFNYAVTLPSDWQIVATGDQLAVETLSTGQMRYTYQTGLVRDVSITFSRQFEILQRTVGDTTLYLALANPETDNEFLLDSAESAFSLYERLFGEYPFASLKIIAWKAVRSSGKEYPALIYVGYNIAEDYKMQKVMAHEIAHQWWFSTVGNDIFNDAWLDEGFAEYSSLLYLRETQGEEVFQNDLKELENSAALADAESGGKYKVGSSLEELSASHYYTNFVYAKGALFLDTLRTQMGEEAFFSGLRAYYQQYQFGVADRQGFLEVMQRFSKTNLAPLFEEWIGMD